MPLTLTEQTDIIEKRLGPPNVDVSFENLVTAAAYAEAMSFADNHKDVSLADTNEQTYVDKITRVGERILSGNKPVIQSLLTILVVKGGANVDVGNLPVVQSGWETFVTTYIFAAMEYVSGVTQEEKTDYDLL